MRYPFMENLHVIMRGDAHRPTLKLWRDSRMFQLFAEHPIDGRLFCGHYDTLDDARDRYVRSNNKDLCQGPGWNRSYVPVVVTPEGRTVRLLEERSPWAREVSRQMAEHGCIKDYAHRDISYPRGVMVKGVN